MAAADFLDQLAAWGFDLGIIDDDRRHLEVAPKPETLKRFLDAGTMINILARRDRSLIDSLLRRQEILGRRWVDRRF